MKLPKELIERRNLANLFKEYDDVNLDIQVLNSATDDEIASHIIEFFVEGSALVYPPKSYFVAIVYAACILKYFPDYYNDITEPLACEDLLDNDKYFKPYTGDATKIYNKVLWWFEKERIEILSLPSTDKTHNYFKEEFLIEA